MLKHFLEFALFGFTMFAAGAPAVMGGGDAAGTVSGDSAGNGGESTAGTAGDAKTGNGSDPVGGDGPDGNASGDIKTGDEGDQSTASDETLTELEGDGRQIPTKYAKLFKEDKALKAMYFRDQLLAKTFPGGVQEAVQAQEIVTSLGGENGIRQIEGELSDYRTTDEMFLKGDPQLVERLFEINPESAANLVASALPAFAKANPEQYNHILGRVIFNTLRQADAIHAAYTVLSQLPDNAAGKEAAQALAEWYNGFKELAEKVPEKKTDQRQAEFDRKARELETREQNQRIETINSQARPQLVVSMENALAKELKASGANLQKLKADNPKAFQRLIANITQEVRARVASDQTFVRNYGAALAEGNTAKCLQMVNAKHAKVVPDAAAAIWREFAGLYGVKAKLKAAASSPGQQSGAQTANGASQVAAKPSRFEINWEHPKTDVYNRIAMLKTGKLVTWPEARA